MPNEDSDNTSAGPTGVTEAGDDRMLSEVEQDTIIQMDGELSQEEIVKQILAASDKEYFASTDAYYLKLGIRSGDSTSLANQSYIHVAQYSTSKTIGPFTCTEPAEKRARFFSSKEEAIWVALSVLESDADVWQDDAWEKRD